MRIRYLAFFVSILAACTTLEKHSLPQEDPERVVISDRISNQRVNAFAEDADGHIWIATFRGLNKYSVHEFHQYFCADDTTGLPDNQINTVFNSADGRLWVATVNGLAYHTDKGCFKRVPILSDNRNISRILETSRGDMLFSNGTSLFRYDTEEQVVKPVIRELNAFVSDMVIDAEGRLWVPTGTSLDCYETTAFTKLQTISVPHMVYHLCDTGNGELWMSGMGRISVFDTRAMQWKDLPDAIRREPRIMGGDVDLIYAIDDRSILLQVIGQGMFYYYKTTGKVTFQDEAGFPFDLPSSETHTVFRDSRSNLWFGTADHGYVVSYQYKGQFNGNKYLTNYFLDKTVISLFFEDGRLWICTQTDGLFVYDLESNRVSRVEVSHLVRTA